MNVEEKERLIKKDIASIENRVRHAFNQGYEMGLKESSSEIPNTYGDAISRQAVMDYFRKWQPYMATRLWDFEQELSELPPVSPQQRTGQWCRKTKVDAYDIAGVKTWGIKCQCDRCDFMTIVVEDFGYYKFCPNCGSRMMEVEDAD